MRLIIAPEAAHNDTKLATTTSHTGRCPRTTNWYRTNSSEPGGTTTKRNRASIRDTPWALARSKIAAIDVRIGNNDNRPEYAIPFAIPKQLSS